MYNNFFGFKVKPFEITPDPNFLYLSPDLREIIATLYYGISQRRGFGLLVGEPGTGKTTLINSLIDKSSINSNFAYIFNPYLNFDDLLHTVLVEFKLATVDEDLSKTKAMHRLNAYLIEQSEKGKDTVIIVDEAQRLDIKTLENLRLLSNLETRKYKLIHIIISGQPELENTLSQKSLSQLAQRIGLRCRTKPLAEKETYEYIDHRLKVAGYNGSQLFANKAKQTIWTYSKGIPRIINIICDNSLLTGYSADQKRIDSSIVKEVIDDLNKVPLNNFDYPQDKSNDTIKEVSQTPSIKSDEICEVSAELSEKKDEDRFNIIDKLRKKLSHSQESAIEKKKEQRFSATWISAIAGFAIIANILILFLFFGSFKEFKNEFSSKLETMKNNFQSQLGGIKNSINRTPSGVNPTIDKSSSISSTDVEDDNKKNTVVIRKGDSLSDIILKAYGKADPKILGAILKINPEIKDPNFIFENQVIKLPKKANLD